MSVSVWSSGPQPERFCPPGAICHIWRHISLSQAGGYYWHLVRGLGLAFSGHRPGMLLNILQRCQTAPRNKGVRPQMAVLLKLSNSVLEIWKAEYMKHCAHKTSLFRSEKYINTKIFIKCVSGYLQNVALEMFFLQPVMVSFMCQPDWAIECPDNWSNILAVSVSMLLDEVNI